MNSLEPYTAYVDDSGTDGKARIVTAALCVAPIGKWKRFEKAWINAEDRYGFKNFHMTEFASCSRDNWCRDCKAGRSNMVDHPWREWSNTKRHRVLAELAEIVCTNISQGFGIAFTKTEIDDHLGDPRLVGGIAQDLVGDHYTFAATTCGGELAKWRKEQEHFPPVKFVFDGDRKDSLARAFLPEYHSGPKFTAEGLERCFDGAEVTFGHRWRTRQLLSADMLAWITTKLRVAFLFPDTYRRNGGWGKEVNILADRFIESEKIRIGYIGKEHLHDWLEREVKCWNPKLPISK